MGVNALEHKEVTKDVKDYLNGIDDRWFVDNCLPAASIMLSGSTGWGIPEGFDSCADWDIHIILNDECFDEYASRYGLNHVIDDHSHDPVVFAQVRNEKWLIDRLHQKESSLIYLWLYENGTWIADPLGLIPMIRKFRQLFDRQLKELVEQHFIAFSVRRLDASSSAKRGLSCAMGIYKSAAVEAALRVFCLCQGNPYPYDKWLPKQVQMLNGAPLVELCEKCLNETTPEKSLPLLKELRRFMEDLVKSKYGEQAWISHWWEYNEN